MDERLSQLKIWLTEVFETDAFSLAPASNDASFRRYFRVSIIDKTFVAMDAPPDREDCGPFMDAAVGLGRIGLNVPQILSHNEVLGFLLLTDLGDKQYLDVLDEQSSDRLYRDAIDSLVTLHVRGMETGLSLLPYDRALLTREVGLFKEWLLEKHLAMALDQNQSRELDAAFEVLIKNALDQQRVVVHRDYHSRNLMVVEKNNPGILDFQDAVIGPVTYDLVSLLRDCYIQWPLDKQMQWVSYYLQQANKQGFQLDADENEFKRHFDLMGMQRHLKAAGIFARLKLRDGRPGYLDDIPRTLGYVADAAQSYDELQWLRQFVTDQVLPKL